MSGLGEDLDMTAHELLATEYVHMFVRYELCYWLTLKSRKIPLNQVIEGCRRVSAFAQIDDFFFLDVIMKLEPREMSAILQGVSYDWSMYDRSLTRR